METFSIEQENYVRLSLLLTGLAPRAVRKLFDREFHPACLTTTIRREHKNIIKHINTEQWKLLKKGQLDSKSFDVSLMICLLRNLTDIQGPRTGYDFLPQPSDQCVGADLARLKYFRNFIAHVSDGKIDNDYFSDAWGDISGAIERLGDSSMKCECDKLKHEPLDQSSVEILKEVRKLNADLAEAREDIEDLKDEIREMNDDYDCTTKTIEKMYTPVQQKRGHFPKRKSKIYKMDVFIETFSFKKIISAIENHQCVIVTGPPGCGKLFNSLKAVYKVKKSNANRLIYDTDITWLLLSRPQPYEFDMVKAMEDSSPTTCTSIHIIDGFFGKSSLNERSFIFWKEHLHKIKLVLRSKYEKVVMTCRSDIYESFIKNNLGIPAFHCPVLYTEAELYEIYHSYETTDGNISLPENPYVRALIPSICSLSDCKLILKNIDTHTTVAGFIKDTMTRLKKDSIWHFRALVFLSVMNNTIDKNIFLKTINSHAVLFRKICLETGDRGLSLIKNKIQSSLSSLVGTFIEETSTTYSFKYQWQFDYVANFVGKENIDIILDHSDSVFIKDRLILPTPFPSKEEDNFLSIKIPLEMKEMFEERLMKDLRKGYLWNVLSNCHERLSEFKIIINWLKISGYISKDKSDKSTVLHIAACFGCTYLVEVLLGSDQSQLDATDSRHQTPLYYASAMGYTEIVQLLIKSRRLLDFIHLQWIGKALYIACINQHHEVVTLLVNYIKVDTSFCFDSSYLQAACENGDQEMVKLLIRHHVSVNQVANLSTPLYIAAYHGHIAIVKMLLNGGASVNIDGIPSTPICIAAFNGHKTIVDILLQNYAAVNTPIKDVLTPVHAASINGHADIVEELLQHKALVNTKYKNMTALCVSCERLHENVIDILLKYNADIENCKNGSSALHIVCTTCNTKDKTSIVKKLLEKNVNINKTDSKGNTALDYALNNSYFKISEILIQNGAEVNHRLGSFFLHEACTGGQNAVVEFLLKNDTSVNVDNKDENGNTALNALCSASLVYSRNPLKSDLRSCRKQNYLDIIKVLLLRDTDVNECNKFGDSPLTSACRTGNYYLIPPLINHDQNLINKLDKNGKTPLFMACINKHKSVVDCLLEYKVDINQKCLDGATALHGIFLPCADTFSRHHTKNQDELLTTLVNVGADVNLTDNSKDTVLHLVCKSNDRICTGILLDQNPILTTKNLNGFTPLHSACHHGNVDIVACLLKHWTAIYQMRYSRVQYRNKQNIASNSRSEKSFINETDFDGRAPLHIACTNEKISIVEMLLRCGAVVDKVDKYKCTPLYFACKKNRENIVHLLLQSKANVNLPCYEGWTALHVACSVGNEHIARLLLQGGADTTIEDVNGLTARQIAFQNGHKNIEEMFICTNAIL